MTEEEQTTLFQQWVRDHLAMMMKVARSFAASPQDREDLMQDILVNLWSSIPRYRGDAKQTTWIYRVAFNTALGWRRGEKRRDIQQKEFAACLANLTAVTSTASSGPNRPVIDRLYEAIGRLPKLDASLAVMHLDGLSYAEMAEILGISESNVGVRLTRMRQRLAETFERISDDI